MRKHLLLSLLLAFYSLCLDAQTILGVDVYHGDSDGSYGAINWSQVHTTAGKTFAFAKATQGVTFTDPAFVTNMTNGNTAGVVMGAYHFASPETNAAVAEANYFLSVARPYIGAGHLPPALDLEDPSGTPLSGAFTSAQLTAWVQAWMTTVFDSTGVKPVLYTTGTYAAYLNSSLNTYGLWVANPNTSPTTPPSNIGVWTTWTFKQYSWTGSVTGIGNPSVDLDVFNGDTTAFNTLIGTATTPVPVCNNDFPCSPAALSVNGSCVNTACSTVNATPPAVAIPFYGGSACATLYQSGRSDDDVWFTITPATASALTISVTPTSNLSNFDPVIGLYSGTCTGLTQVACADLHGVGVAEQINYTPTAGTTYLVRVFSYGIGSTYSGDFNICAYSPCAIATQPVITGDSVICNSGTAALSISNVCSGCTYSWSGGGTGTSHTVSAAGTYYVTVTSSCGSTAISNGWSVANTTVAVSGSSNPVSPCSGQSFNLSATGANTYLWSGQGLAANSGSTVSASLSTGGAYTYTITGYTGTCSATATVNISVAQTPTVSINPSGPVSLCSSGANSSAVLQASGATTYVWSPSTGLSSASVSNPTASNLSAPTTYTVTGTTNGCSATASVHINVTQTPTVSINPSGPVSLCSSGANSSAALQASGATTYAWSPSTGLSSASVSNPTASNLSAPTTYTVTGTTNGCSATASVHINVTQTPVISVNPTATTICAGGTGTPLTVTGAAQTYSWSPATGLDSTTTSTVNANPPSTQTYTVTVSNGSCTATAASTVNVSSQPQASLSPAAPNIGCTATSVTLTASPAGTAYSWSGPGGNFSSTTDSVSVTIAGQYSVTITNAGGCNITATASANVTQSVGLTVNAGSDQSILLGDSVAIGGNPTANGGNGSYTYSWSSSPSGYSSSAADPTVKPTMTTTYTVTAIDANGCSGTESVTITVIPPPSCDTTIHPVITANSCYLAAPFYPNAKYQWALQGIPLAGDTLQFYAAIGTGYYTCGIRLDTCSYQSNAIYLDCPSGIADIKASQKLKIIPNPSSGTFVFSFSSDHEEEMSISIFDLMGQIIYEKKTIKTIGNFNQYLSLENIAKGTYILQVKTATSLQSTKVQIE